MPPVAECSCGWARKTINEPATPPEMVALVNDVARHGRDHGIQCATQIIGGDKTPMMDITYHETTPDHLQSASSVAESKFYRP